MNSAVQLGVLAIVSLFAITITAFSQNVPELRERLEAVDASHPRLFIDSAGEAALKQKIDQDALLRAAYKRIEARADASIEEPLLKREKVGRRLLGVSRACLDRVTHLAFTYRMTGETKYLNRAQEAMMAVSGFDDWNPSHFLDVAEMTAALAIGYDWLYDELDPAARDTIRDAIIEKGLKTSLAGGWWVKTENNWNQVCHGGLTLGALAVVEDEIDLAEQIIARSLENVPRAMHEYDPDGVYPEGPSYWKYGTTYNVILISALQSVLGTDFGLGNAEGFMRSAEFYLQATGPSGMFFNFSDCGTNANVSTAMYWFASRQNRPSLLWNERKELTRFIEQGGAKTGGRTQPFLLIWAGSMDNIVAPETLHWKGDGRTPIAVHRSSWDENATYFAIKGGSAHTNHAHMDAGSFVLEMEGVRWAVDLGSQSYNSLESRGIDLWNRSQGSERWTVYRLNNFSHNTLVVDNKLHRVEGHAPIMRFSDEADSPFTIVDLTPVYAGDLAKAQRGAFFHENAVLIQDEIETLDKPTTIRWGMATQADADIEDESHVILREGEKTLNIRVLSPASVKATIIDMENPPNDHDAANKDTRMVAFEVTVPGSSRETIAVQIGTGDVGNDPFVLKPLGSW